MVIVETHIFTKLINKLMTDEDYREFQAMIIDQPDTGNIISGSGGIRKIRWRGSGRGKRGGSRFIYYWAANLDQIYMLFAYAKNEVDDLTKEQLKTLQKIVVLEFENE